MTCLVHDANQRIEAKHGGIKASVSMTRSILYADDTLIVEADGAVAQEFMEAIQTQSKRYGLEFNNAKLEILRIDCEHELHDDNGRLLKSKDCLVYLGSLLRGDGRVHGEVSRRIGAASSSFSELCHVWNHGNISSTKKLQFYSACVLTNLFYSL